MLKRTLERYLRVSVHFRSSDRDHSGRQVLCGDAESFRPDDEHCAGSLRGARVLYRRTTRPPSARLSLHSLLTVCTVLTWTSVVNLNGRPSVQEGVQVLPVGLYIIRGDNMCDLPSTMTVMEVCIASATFPDFSAVAAVLRTVNLRARGSHLTALDMLCAEHRLERSTGIWTLSWNWT